MNAKSATRILTVISIIAVLLLAFQSFPKVSAAVGFFEDGFETGDFSKWSVIGGSPPVTSGDAHYGTYKAVLDSAGEFAQAKFTGVDHAFMRAYVMFKSFPGVGANTTVLGLFNELPGGYVFMAEARVVNVAGTVKWAFRYYDNDTHHVVVSELEKPVLDTWYSIEVESKSNTTTDSESRIYINGTELTDISQTGKNNSLQIIGGFIAAEYNVTRWYDDVVINTTYIGPVVPATATTDVATSISTTGATLNGVVNANGYDTTVTFEYGTTTGYGSTITATQSPVTGSSSTPVSAAITGLISNTTYHFRVVGVNEGGTTNGLDATFTTAETLTVTGPTSVTYGSTGTITTSGGSGTGAMSYSAGVSTGCTVDASSGLITATDPSGTCNVTATKAADTYYIEATSAEYPVTLNKRAVELSGNRTYDGTNTASYGILSVSNKVGTDDVTVASGSGTLGSPDVGSRSITSSGTLALGGTAAGNYTLTGATGSVTISALSVNLTGGRTYDGTATAAFGILSVSNKVGTDDVTVASGSGELESPDVGSRAITSFGTLALGGTAAGNYTLTGATGSVTISALAVNLTGSRTYDGTATAAFGILSVSNRVGTDDVTVASGSGTLESPDVGSRAITSFGTLALGGTAAGNYTLTGATGSVTITKADQATLTVTGPASLKVGSTGTITTSGGSGTGAMSYSAGGSTGCTVNASSGLIMATNASGTCTVTATKAADTNYNAVTSAGHHVILDPVLIFLPIIGR